MKVIDDFGGGEAPPYLCHAPRGGLGGLAPRKLRYPCLASLGGRSPPIPVPCPRALPPSFFLNFFVKLWTDVYPFRIAPILTILPDSESSRRDLSFESRFDFFVFFFRVSVRPKFFLPSVRPKIFRPSEIFPSVQKFSVRLWTYLFLHKIISAHTDLFN